MTVGEIRKRLQAMGNPTLAVTCQRFFKTGPGDYGEGDIFLGIRADPLRKFTRECRGSPLSEVETLLHSPIHESRALALLLLVDAMSDVAKQRQIFDFYLANTRFVNNWDLVDLSARDIAGAYLYERSRRPLHRLARSKLIWERRIAIVATHHFIRQHDFADTLTIAERLLDDREDLIHKAVGWMLREIGKRDQDVVEAFLREHHARMPRTALRYAIERFPEKKRQAYLRRNVTKK